MRKCDLDVQRHCDNVRHEHKHDADGPSGKRSPKQAVSEQKPIARHECDLRGSNPPRLATTQARRPFRKNMKPRQEVEVEPSDAHDGVVGISLVRHEEVGGSVPNECEVVVAGSKGLEEARASSEEGDVLNIGIVFL